MSNRDLDSKTLSIIGRDNNAVILDKNGDVIITTDLLTDNPECSLTFEKIDKILHAMSDLIILDGRRSGNAYTGSVPYGERLVEVLKWIIEVMLSHSHPPNAAAIPDFHTKAFTYLRILDDWLLNERVKHR